MKDGEFKIVYTFSSKDDIRKMRKYILDTFQYRELGENFIKKMKEATEEIRAFPLSFNAVPFQYRGYAIRLKSYRTYLFFYAVDIEKMTVTVLRVMQDGMDWRFILNQWLKKLNRQKVVPMIR